jgi:hypothetical protein
MSRRLSFALGHVAAASLLLFAVAAIPAQAPKPADPKVEPKAKPAAVVPTEAPATTKDLRGSSEQTAKVFQEISRGLFTLAQRLEKSERPEDKERAKTIYAALEHAQKASIDAQFKTLIGGLSKGSDNPQDLGGLQGKNKELIQAITEMIAILQTEDESERLKKEIATLERFLKEAEDIKRRTEVQRAMTETGKGDPNKQANQQKDLAEQTKDLAERMAGKKGGDPKGSPSAKEDPKSRPKGEAKEGENSADAKSDSAGDKADPKDGKDGGDPMKGDKGSDAKPMGKDGDPKGGDPKPGGDPKDGAGEPKGSGEPKAGEPKAGEPKAGEPKAGEPKAGEPKAGEPKAGEPKAGEPKAGEPKAGPPGEAKGTGQGKGEPKSSKGQQAQGGEARGKGGKPMEGEQQAQGQSKGGGQPSGGQPPPGGQQPPPNQQAQTPGRKQVEEAYPHQKGAEDDLRKPDNKEAAKKQDKAIESLAKAIEELKKKLKQLREEEMLKTLAALEARCNRMLSMQIEVYEGTKAVHSIVVKNGNMKTTAEHQKSQQLGDKETEIVSEAEKALKLLESEGSAVAFASVLEEVKGDMQAVQKRLAATWVDTDTQVIEENIIQILKDMIAALKKAQQDIKDQQGKPSPPSDGKPGPKQLIDLLAELKLIRAFQTQVNSRTKMYATKYTGEQASDPIIQGELRQLSQRQAKLQDMVHKIATGANK